MAKRKTAPRRTPRRGTGTSRARSSRRPTSTSSRARATVKSSGRSTGGRARTGAAKAASRKRAPASRGRSATPRPKPASRAASHARAKNRKTAPVSKRPAPPRTAAPPRPAANRPVKVLQRRESAARRRQIERDRRLIEEALPTPPSSLDLDRRPSAARSGRAELAEELGNHNAADPDVAGGDVDADWASAYSTGDEAPGGDMPTPDQDVVEEIGSALGVKYADGEELKGANKIEQRDRHRWELDPASAEDYQDRSRQK